MTIATSLLLLIVLVTRRQARRWLGAQAAYLLWALPLIRMILQPVPVSLGSATGSLGALSHTAHIWSADIIVPAPASAGLIGLALLCVWLGGTAATLLVQVVRYRLFLARHLPSRTALRKCGKVKLAKADVDGPLAGGIVDRFVLLPLDFSRRFAPRQRGLVVRHEITHHRRGDIAANAAATLFLAVHWWNPIAHIAYRAFRQDQELACDAGVLAGRSPAQRRAYADALVAAAGLSPAPTCGWRGQYDLAERLREIAGLQTGAPKNTTGLSVAMAAIGLLLSASAVSVRQAGVAKPHHIKDHFAVLTPMELTTAIEVRPPALTPTPQRQERRAGKPKRPLPASTAALISASGLNASSLKQASQEVSVFCPPGGLPGNDCEREQSRRRSLTLVRNRVAADATLPVEQQTMMLREMDEEMVHPHIVLISS